MELKKLSKAELQRRIKHLKSLEKKEKNIHREKNIKIFKMELKK